VTFFGHGRDQFGPKKLVVTFWSGATKPDAQKPVLPVTDGKQAKEPCDEDMQNSQDDARLDTLLQPCDDISTATERTANGGDFRLQLPPTHPLAAVQFASEGLQQANPEAQSMSRQYQFGISLTLESNSTLQSPHDSVAALAGATVHDPNMLVANSKNDPASLISPHMLKTFTDLQPMSKESCGEGPRTACKSSSHASMSIQMSSGM